MSRPLQGLRRLSGAALFTLALVYSGTIHGSPALEPDWSRDFFIPENGRANPYNITADEIPDVIRKGRLHALNYPVEVSGILLPYEAIGRFLRADSSDPLRHLLQKTVGGLGRLRSYEDLQNWLGLHPYPEREGEGPYFIPFKNGRKPDIHMGFTLIDTPHGTGFTISCAQCHSSNLFGRRVIGLTNRFPRPNSFFERGLKTVKLVTVDSFRWSTEASEGDVRLFASSKKSMPFVGAKRPVQLGLDTSLAQVALALAKRAKDPWASRDTPLRHPRPEPLSKFVADSKPAVWWNVKYKNRFLSDGSVVSGNPIFTNILWNELGRGTDLRLLEGWLKRNTETIRELTTAVLSSEAPRFTDFFPASEIDLAEAKRGQALFNDTCAKCHGRYTKAWEAPNAAMLNQEELLETTKVVYQPKKPVFDVGTDPGRYQGMKSLAQLNDLEISQANGIVIEPQQGYVPPPLVGIWARWPYFHNNSAPSLCAVLTRGEERPVTYWARPADDPRRDFDSECNGYPRGTPVPSLPKAYFYDTRRTGMSNRGHDERILLKEGREAFTPSEKRALIRFLQTL